MIFLPRSILVITSLISIFSIATLAQSKPGHFTKATLIKSFGEPVDCVPQKEGAVCFADKKVANIPRQFYAWLDEKDFVRKIEVYDYTNGYAASGFAELIVPRQFRGKLLSKNDPTKDTSCESHYIKTYEYLKWEFFVEICRGLAPGRAVITFNN